MHVIVHEMIAPGGLVGVCGWLGRCFLDFLVFFRVGSKATGKNWVQVGPFTDMKLPTACGKVLGVFAGLGGALGGWVWDILVGFP